MPRPPSKQKLRIPPAHEGIQVNFCKKTDCSNFGIPPLESIKGIPLPKKADSGGKKRSRDNYSVNSRQDSSPALECELCGQKPPMKSNQGVYEELTRMWKYLVPPQQLVRTCPNTECEHHNQAVEVTAGTKHYYKDGKQESGGQRYICRECKRTFTINENPAARQNKPSLNALIFRLLVNKMPLQRICEVAEVSMPTLYAKIDFIHEQCLKFAASQERKLPNLQIRRLQISLDRQDYLVNWTETVDKRNVVIHAMGSADNRTGFVFGMHLNFDQDAQREAIEQDALICGDHATKPPFRKYPRYWLAPDFVEATKKAVPQKNKSKALVERISEDYAEAELREDIESFEQMNASVKLPRSGMQIHGEYTIYGHLMFLKRLLPKAEKIRFYMEKESGMRAACLSAFAEDILNERVDAFYVKINKEMTIAQKNAAMAKGRRELETFRDSSSIYAEADDNSLRALMFERKIEGGDFFLSGKFKDKWYLYPAPLKNEPEKAVSWLTYTGPRRYGNFHLAKLMLRASLFGIDRFFMQVRRRISLLERPIASSSSSGRKWYGYSPYNPAYIVKILEIFRVYHNYVNATATFRRRKLQPGEKKRNPGEVQKTFKTPAMRLGLSSVKAQIDDILSFCE